MFFYQKNKLSFGPTDEDPDLMADRMQAITNLACGCFEGDILDPNGPKASTVWKLSDFFEPSSISFNVESKLQEAFNSLERQKEDREEILK